MDDNNGNSNDQQKVMTLESPNPGVLIDDAAAMKARTPARHCRECGVFFRARQLDSLYCPKHESGTI